MRSLFLMAISLMALPSTIRAQEAPPLPRAMAHVSLGAGGLYASLDGAGVVNFGGGGQVRLYQGLSASAESSYFFSIQSPNDGMGLFSANASYHFFSVSRKAVPFVTGGYSRFNEEDMANFGGGMDYWLGNRAALRMELRYHTAFPDRDPQILLYRIGLVLR